MKKDGLASRRGRLSPEKRALLERRLRGETAGGAAVSVIPSIAQREQVPLSSSQERLWFIQKLEPSLAAYNIPAAFRWRGPLDAELLEQAINAVLARQEALRLVFGEADGTPYQCAAPHEDFKLDTIDLVAFPESEREAEAIRIASDDAARPFDLIAGPVFRAKLLKITNEDHLLCMTIHHIVCDGWSLGVLLNEIGSAYGALLGGKAPTFPPLAVTFIDYAHWQRERLGEAEREKHLRYWREQLSGELPTLELPTDYPRPATQSFRGATICHSVNKTLSDGLELYAQQEGVTLFTVLLAGWNALLHRYTGQDDILVGSGFAGRNRAELEGLVGFFVNTVVLRSDLSGEPSFRELVQRVSTVALGAHDHQDLPFGELVSQLRTGHDASRSPLFQVMFVLNNTVATPPMMGGLDIEPTPVHNDSAKMDLTLSSVAGPLGIELAAEYNTDLFTEDRIRLMLGHFQGLLEAAVADPECEVSRLLYFPQEERARLLFDLNATSTAYPRDASIPGLFEAQVAARPDACALSFGDTQVSYGDLNAWANRLARYLRARSVGKESPVGLCMERGIELVVAVLAILKAGGAYVPLDPKYPTERLRYMIEDSGVAAILVEAACAETLPETPAVKIILDTKGDAIAGESPENLEDGPEAGMLAYIMYTSGSTGQPKGVCIEHRSVLRLVKDTSYAQFGPDEVFLLFAPISFDASTLELWGPLLNGGRLAIAAPGPLSLSELGKRIEAHGVTTLWLTAGLFHQMVDHELAALCGLRQLLAGGDVLSVPHVKRCLAALTDTVLINGYGPTESTTFTCCHPMKRDAAIGERIPIGRPIANTTVYILDHNLEPVPVGVFGELYIGGDGLARGYHNDPEKTAEKFVPHPFSDEPGARLYATGDLVRYLPSGEIEFSGRKDTQVKLRGFRIELGEIETVLSTHPGIAETVVVVREAIPGDKRICAYAVAMEGNLLAPGELAAFLRDKLPDYMVPSTFVILDALPLTSNGKVDRQRLPAPVAAVEESATLSTPESPIEKQLAAIWCTLLQVEQIGRGTRFFDAGGHSLLAVRLLARVREELGAEVPLRDFMEQPTIAALAARIEMSGADGPAPKRGENRSSGHLRLIREEASASALFLIEGAGSAADTYADLVKYLEPGFNVYGIDFVQEAGYVESIEELAAQYLVDIKRAQPEGPYHLAGWSFGGMVAFELARQLRNLGDTVGVLGLFETFAPKPLLAGLSHWSARVSYIAQRGTNRVKMFWYVRAYLPAYFLDTWSFWRRGQTGGAEETVTPTLKECLGYIRHDINRQYSLARSGLARPSPRDNRMEVLLDPFVRSINRRISANKRLITEYVLKPYDGRVTLFCADEDTHDNSQDALIGGWKDYAEGGVDLHVLPGNHFVLLRAPFVESVARHLSAAMTSHNAKPPTP